MNFHTYSLRKIATDQFESRCENKPQGAVAGTKDTIVTDTNKIIHRKRIGKPLKTKFQNPLSRRVDNLRGKDGRFVQPQQFEDNDITAEHSERCSTPVLEKSGLDNTLEMENTTISPVYSRGRKNLIKDRSTTTTPTPGPEINARPTTENNQKSSQWWNKTVIPV